MFKMKKVLFTLLVCVVAFASCSKDDDENNLSLTKEQVVGTWNVVWVEMDGKGTDVPDKSIYITLKEDGSYKTVFLSDSYIGTYKIEGNTVVGVTPDPITEYYKFIDLKGSNASIDYSNSDGDKYKFRAVKR